MLKRIFSAFFFSILLANTIFCDSIINNQGVEEKLIIVIIPSYNNLTRFERNIDSVLVQKYTNYRVIYIDDCSTDGMSGPVRNYIMENDWHDRWTYIRNTENHGALCNLYHAIHTCPDDAIIVTLDGDDEFKHENVLARVNCEYADSSVWLTYGNFELKSTGQRGWCTTLPFEVRRNVYVLRRYCGFASHLRTFYAWLFKKIKKEDLLYQGKFYPAAWDRAMMAPMLEMASPHHFRCIGEVLYVYDDNTSLNDHALRYQLQWDLSKYIIELEPYFPLDEL